MSARDWGHVLKYKEDIINGDALVSIWLIEDIKTQAESNGRATISDEDAREILSMVEGRHDACIGINWDVIDFNIDSFYQGEA